MPKFTLFSLLLLFISQHLCAQTTAPTEAWIGTGTVQARIVAGGPLVTDFQIPNILADTLVSALNELSLWLGGTDAAANYRLSIQHPENAKNDFAGGFRDIPQSARVWKVTKDQIIKHQLDFADNGVIDDPIPDIFAWPARKNPWSMQYNGFAVMDSFDRKLTAPYAEWGPDQYDPAKGDYPHLTYVIYNIERQPDEMVFVPFHVKIVSAQFPDITPISVNGSAFFFTYYCDDADFLDHAVFGYVTLEFPKHDQLNDLYLAFRMDAQIGDPQDDYFGYIPGHSVAYFYNSDTSIITGSNQFPPVVGFDVYGGITDTFGDLKGITNVILINPDDPVWPAYSTEPVNQFQYYRCISGHWRDGQPLTHGGTGYGGSVLAQHIFPDAPFDTSGWSEISAGNQPGDRRAIISSGPVNTTNEYTKTDQVLFALNYVPGDKSLSGQWETLRERSLDQGDFFYADFFPPAIDPYDTLACFKTSSVISLPGLTPVSIFPNPTRGQLQIDAGTVLIQEIKVYDLAGRLVLAPALTLPGSSRITLDLQGLPPGLYFIYGMLDNKGQFVQRVVVTG
jgi:hypothetical protein